jgi:hypothetical protein
MTDGERVDRLEERVAALEALVGKLAGQQGSGAAGQAS